MAKMKRGRAMRKFTRGWVLISPTRQVFYRATLLHTTRTEKDGTRTATFRYRAGQHRTKRP